MKQMESGNQLSQLQPVDIAIVGGTTSAVAAALECRAAGLSVLLFTGRTYLGDDICDSLRLALPSDLDCTDPLVNALYGQSLAARKLLRPMQVKQVLDEAMIGARIPVLFGCAPGELLLDSTGAPAGVTVCSRSGRFGLRCRTLIDGTMRAEVARMAGIPLSAPAEEIAVVRRVIGGQNPERMPAGDWMREGTVEFPDMREQRSAPLWAYHARASLRDGSWAAWMALEQAVRMEAFRPGQLQSADGIFALSGERLHPDRPAVDCAGDLTRIPAEAVRDGSGRIWFTGPVGAIDPVTREQLLHPGCAVQWGWEVARAVCASLPPLMESGPTLHSSARIPLPAPMAWSDPRAGGSGLKTEDAALELTHDGFSEILDVDVLVAGGGTAGAGAAIAAARAGRRTLVVESLSGLGGISTLGLIGRYWHGNRCGFTQEVDQATQAMYPGTLPLGNAWDIETKLQWYHQEATRAGGIIWYKSMVCGALHDGSRVAGAIVATPQGRVAVRARCVVDATGCADVAAAAGAETVTPGDRELMLQGTGLPGRTPGNSYHNTDYEFIDDTCIADCSSACMSARRKFAHLFDDGQLVDSRERRRIVGDCELTPCDTLFDRAFPDTICRARSNFDSHGCTVHPALEFCRPKGKEVFDAHVPLRALLPRELDGILVTGLGISAHRDALPIVRMIADVQNQGYAAGLIASMAHDGRVRELDIAAIQRKLITVGILTEEDGGAADSFPLPAGKIREDMEQSMHDPGKVRSLYTLEPHERIALLHEAFRASDNDARRRHFALLLGLAGDAAGADELAAEVAQNLWDAGFAFSGMGKFGSDYSAMDLRILALGRTRKTGHLPVLLEKCASLPADTEYSHCRALSEALAVMGDRSAAPALAEILRRPGLRGHAQTSLEARLEVGTISNWHENTFRNRALREMALAEALYHLDPDNAPAHEILAEYRGDMRGFFARHAAKILEGSASHCYNPETGARDGGERYDYRISTIATPRT
jgi:hypothetical protein